MRRREIPFRTQIERLLSKQNLIRFDLRVPVERLHYRAASGAQVFGTDATSVSPLLVCLLDSPAQLVRSVTITALGRVASNDPEVFRHIVKALDDKDWTVRHSAWISLQFFGEHIEQELEPLSRYARDVHAENRALALRTLCSATKYSANVIPLLVSSLQDSNCQVRGTALSELATSDPQITIPALIAGLRDEKSGVRDASARGLGNFGPLASNAIPALVESLSHSDRSFAEWAAKALKTIDPEAARQAGVL